MSSKIFEKVVERGLPWRDPLPTLAFFEAVVLVAVVFVEVSSAEAGVSSAEAGVSAVVWRAAAWAAVSSLAMA